MLYTILTYLAISFAICLGWIAICYAGSAYEETKKAGAIKKEVEK